MTTEQPQQSFCTPSASRGAGVGMESPTVIVQPALLSFCQSLADSDVGIGEAELEAHIRDLGLLIEQEIRNGNRALAREHQAAMYAAIESRSPAKKAAMEAAIDRRIKTEHQRRLS